MSPNKQFSTISHIVNFNKINNYSNNINSVRIPFKNILHKKHNNIIKIKLSNKKNNKSNNNEIEIETRNRNKILKPLNTNHLTLNLIKMFNKNERRNEVKVYDSLSNNYNENTFRTQENYINSNRRPSSIYKKNLLLRNNRRKHNKINSMKFNEFHYNTLRSKIKNIISINTIDNSNINNISKHSKQNTSNSIGKNKGFHSKNKTKQSLNHKIKTISFGDFIKKMK